jgi:hypothetical protein
MANVPVYSNDVRDLARVAAFGIPPAAELIDGREPEEKAVGGSEGGSCLLPSREGDNGQK